MIKTEGIILRRYDAGEDGTIVHVLTPDYGKLKLIDNYLKKKEVYGGKADLFSLVEVFFNNSPEYEINYLLGIESIDKFSSLLCSIENIKTVSMYMEMISGLVGLRNKQKNVYLLLRRFLKDAPGDEVALKERTCLFLARSLMALGHYPDFDHCLNCRQVIKESSYALKGQLGLVCMPCLRTTGVHVKVSKEQRLWLSQLFVDENTRPSSINPAYNLTVLSYFVEGLLGWPLKSADFK